MAVVTAYIDGFNLYHGMRSLYRRKYMWLDVVELVRRVRPDDRVAVVRYFTAIVKNEPVAAANQINYLGALEARNGQQFDVRLGRFKTRTIGRCRVCRQEFRCACPASYLSYEEKETDVALGVAAVEDAARGVGEVTLLISADSDLIPAVQAIKRIDPARRIYVAMPPSYLPRSARFTGVGLFHIRESVLKAALLPPVVTDLSTGRRFERPAKWS
jgi:NYN domain